MSPETFAARFKEAREKKNITIKALQPLVGASPSAMNGYATGKTLPPLDVASKIAQELGVSLDWLCGTGKGETAIDNCADVAVALETIRGMFKRARITVACKEKEYLDASDGPVSWTEYYTQLTIASEALYSYFKQMEATEDFYRSLPAESQSGFEPFKASMHESQLARLRAITGYTTGLIGNLPLTFRVTDTFCEFPEVTNANAQETPEQ